MHPCLQNLKPGDALECDGSFGVKHLLPFVRFGRSGTIVVTDRQNGWLVDVEINLVGCRNLKIIKAKCSPA